jgi:hypothetical protein
MPKLFTKSAFNHAVECPMRAYYYRNSKEYAYHYEGPDGVAEVGDQFGALACVYEGIPNENIIQRGGANPIEAQAKSIADTLKLLREENVDIGEAAFATDKYLVYVDILHKRGDELEIIEVKSKCIGANSPLYKIDHKGNLTSKYIDKILDVTFQKYVIQQFIKTHSEFSHLKVRASLMLANSDAICDMDSLSSLLRIKFLESGHREIECAPDICEKLKGKSRIDRIIDVDCISDQIIADEIRNIADDFFGGCFVKFVEKTADMYVNNRKDYSLCHIGTDCFKCPFRKESDDDKLDGHVECFQNVCGVNIAGKSAITNVKDASKGLPASLKKAWLEQKKFFLTDIDEYEFVPAANATPEAFQKRTELSDDDLRYLHVHSAKTGSNEPTFLKAAAKKIKWKYPLHFIDFETYLGAVPLFKGNRPNEEIAYQFSHHIAYEDGRYEHAGEYISLEPGKFPNFEFIRELKRQLEKDNGDIFRYADHENSILNAIRIQLIDSNESDKEDLIQFIEAITHPTGSSKNSFVAGSRDMKDLKVIAQKYFYHPSMGSSNSIKQVMPAILQSDPYFREKYGDDMDPYHNLPSLDVFAEEVKKEGDAFPADFDDSDVWNADKQINKGGISKLDYVLLQAGRFNKLHTEAIRRASLEYCKLDTLSMVRIWEYFRISTKE